MWGLLRAAACCALRRLSCNVEAGLMRGDWQTLYFFTWRSLQLPMSATVASYAVPALNLERGWLCSASGAAPCCTVVDTLKLGWLQGTQRADFYQRGGKSCSGRLHVHA